MYSFGLYCDDCCSNYMFQAVSANPGPQECGFCGSHQTEVFDFGVDHAWRTEVLAGDGDPEAELIEMIRRVFGSDVEELDPEGWPMAASLVG